MKDDPLASFRRTQKTDSTNVPAEPNYYEAYGIAGDRSPDRRLEVRQVLAAWHAPSYRYLMDVVFDGAHGTEIVLVFSFLMVKIKGRNLQAVRRAIIESTCTFIQDYDPREFSLPANDAPVIEKIELVVKDGE